MRPASAAAPVTIVSSSSRPTWYEHEHVTKIPRLEQLEGAQVDLLVSAARGGHGAPVLGESRRVEHDRAIARAFGVERVEAVERVGHRPGDVLDPVQRRVGFPTGRRPREISIASTSPTAEAR